MRNWEAWAHAPPELFCTLGFQANQPARRAGHSRRAEARAGRVFYNTRAAAWPRRFPGNLNLPHRT